MLTEAEPNAAHLALAELERLGFVEAVVTQNIDLLHERAGSREVVEVHGSIRSATCPGCGKREPLERVLELLAEADAPLCPACGEILKPDVVFFGELLPAAAIERASQLARAAALLLVVGSALEVYPVAGLPQETLAAGGQLAIVNRSPTPYDARAALKIDGSAARCSAGQPRRYAESSRSSRSTLRERSTSPRIVSSPPSCRLSTWRPAGDHTAGSRSQGIRVSARIASSSPRIRMLGLSGSPSETRTRPPAKSSVTALSVSSARTSTRPSSLPSCAALRVSASYRASASGEDVPSASSTGECGGTGPLWPGATGEC